MLQWVVAGAWSVGRTGVRKGAYVGYVMNAVRYPLVGQSTVTSTKYKRAGIALLPFGSASTLNYQSQLLIGSLIVRSNALDCVNHIDRTRLSWRPDNFPSVCLEMHHD